MTDDVLPTDPYRQSGRQHTHRGVTSLAARNHHASARASMM